jgi:hypothetical protein
MLRSSLMHTSSLLTKWCCILILFA